jgi:hypothetical protein
MLESRDMSVMLLFVLLRVGRRKGERGPDGDDTCREG